MTRAVFTASVLCLQLAAQPASELTVSGTGFLLDGKPFDYTGVSFFNALYNPALHRSSEERQRRLTRFHDYEVNVLRVWAQWDNPRGFVDSCKECTLYQPDGGLRAGPVRRLKDLATDAAKLGMVVELVLFSQESWRSGIRLGDEAADRAVIALARELLPHRNLAFQIWNEFSHRTLDSVKLIRGIDSRRLVTSSPGFAGVLGSHEENLAFDYLTPHTSRQSRGKPWDIAPKEIAYLLALYRKPVVDDEPARNGTAQFGGPKEPTVPFDHILQISRVWEVGGYVTYHHDMFQLGAGAASVPPDGIPDPEFSPYHRQVFEFLKHRRRYRPQSE